MLCKWSLWWGVCKSVPAWAGGALCQLIRSLRNSPRLLKSVYKLCSMLCVAPELLLWSSLILYISIVWRGSPIGQGLPSWRAAGLTVTRWWHSDDSYDTIAIYRPSRFPLFWRRSCGFGCVLRWSHQVFATNVLGPDELAPLAKTKISKCWNDCRFPVQKEHAIISEFQSVFPSLSTFL